MQSQRCTFLPGHAVARGAALSASGANYFSPDFVLTVAEPIPRLCGTTSGLLVREPTMVSNFNSLVCIYFSELSKKLGRVSYRSPSTDRRRDGPKGDGDVRGERGGRALMARCLRLLQHL